MTIVRYKRATMIVQTIGGFALALGAAWAFFQVDSIRLEIVFGAVALTLPVVSAALAIRAVGDCAALGFDARGATVSTLWARTEISWASVKSIHRETVQQSSGYGLFKQTIGWYLVIVTHEGDGFEKRLKLNEKLLDWPPDAMETLIAELNAARMGGGRVRGVPPMAATPVAPVLPVQPIRPSFGRRGV